MIWVWLGLGVVGLLIGMVLVLWILGARLPAEHVSGATLRLSQPPEAVWGVIADVASQPAWSPGVTRVERLPGREGREVWRLVMGRNSFVTERTGNDPPRSLTMTITDEHGPFSGSWEYRVDPEGAGSVVRLVERGRIKGPVPRAVMRYLVGEDAYVRKHLAGLAKRFSEPARIAAGAEPPGAAA